jgi:hypothetical protein
MVASRFRSTNYGSRDLCRSSGGGKTTFYQERFFHTDVRISLDMLRSRRREQLLLEACLKAGQRFVFDNTNTLASSRARYIEPSQTFKKLFLDKSVEGL